MAFLVLISGSTYAVVSVSPRMPSAASCPSRVLIWNASAISVTRSVHVSKHPCCGNVSQISATNPTSSSPLPETVTLTPPSLFSWTMLQVSAFLKTIQLPAGSSLQRSLPLYAVVSMPKRNARLHAAATMLSSASSAMTKCTFISSGS